MHQYLNHEYPDGTPLNDYQILDQGDNDHCLNWLDDNLERILGIDAFDDSIKNPMIWNEQDVPGFSRPIDDSDDRAYDALADSPIDIALRALLGPVYYAFREVLGLNIRVSSPIAFDLNGNGAIDLIALENSGAFFDLDSDGFRENAQWVDSGDGLLALDLDGNGTIDDYKNQALAPAKEIAFPV